MVGDGLAVVGDLAFYVDAKGLEVRGVLHVADATGGSQEGLGGDAATVHAGSADIAAGEDGGLQALAARVQGGAVTTDAASCRLVRWGLGLERKQGEKERFVCGVRNDSTEDVWD